MTWAFLFSIRIHLRKYIALSQQPVSHPEARRFFLRGEGSGTRRRQIQEAAESRPLPSCLSGMPAFTRLVMMEFMATYLITGVAGFIGSTLARAVLAQGDHVRGVDNFATGRQENIEEIKERIDFREADIVDPEAMKCACEGVDFVLHQAAIPSVPKSVLDPVGNNRANVDGTLNVLVAARDAKVRRVIYAASSSAYGDTPTLPKHEEMVPSPISPYAVAKLASEHYMTSFYRCYGLETVCLRYFNIFGPRQDPTSPYSGVLARFISQMLKGEPPTIFGDGKQSRDFTYVDNVVSANILACRASRENAAGKVFNVATGQRIDLNETFRVLKKLTAYEGNVKYAEERAGDVKHSLADISRAEKAIGYKPHVSLEEGLRKTVEWYRTQMKLVATT
jgi:nucleoside-diphosphate-sugar epimerase